MKSRELIRMLWQSVLILFLFISCSNDSKDRNIEIESFGELLNGRWEIVSENESSPKNFKVIFNLENRDYFYIESPQRLDPHKSDLVISGNTTILYSSKKFYITAYLFQKPIKSLESVYVNLEYVLNSMNEDSITLISENTPYNPLGKSYKVTFKRLECPEFGDILGVWREKIDNGGLKTYYFGQNNWGQVSLSSINELNKPKRLFKYKYIKNNGVLELFYVNPTDTTLIEEENQLVLLKQNHNYLTLQGPKAQHLWYTEQ